MGISPYAAIVIGSKNMLMKVYEISGGKGFRTVDEIRYEYELGKEAYFTRKKLGPEPTNKTFKYVPFERALMHSGKSIKPLLLEQKLVAGLGNIYVDEVLWAAKVHPETPANKLSKAAMKRVHDQTIAILQLGIAKGGSTIRTYRNALGEDGTMQNYLQVYGKTGQPCPRCASMIVKIKLGGRGTHLCPHCQKR